LFAARGPATDGRGTPPVEPEANEPGRQGSPRPEDLPEGSLLGPDLAKTGSAQDSPEDTSVPAPTPGARAADAPGVATPPAGAPAPVMPEEPLTGEVPAAVVERAGNPIFDTVSMWFSSDSGEKDRVIDLRDRPGDAGSRAESQRWSTLGDQRWLATTARAAAGPEVAGTTDVGLPRRRPGANLIPSAAAAAPVTAPAGRPDGQRRAPAVTGARGEGPGRVDADAVRGRLSSYQRGLTSARRARHLPAERPDGGLHGGGDNDPGRSPGEQGG
jgi:hypothetical protein